jgi:hypothetical protein
MGLSYKQHNPRGIIMGDKKGYDGIELWVYRCVLNSKRVELTDADVQQVQTARTWC